mgnify:CR=1 FL=1
MDYQKRYREWLENDYFDADTKPNSQRSKRTIMRSKNDFIKIWNLELQDFGE